MLPSLDELMVAKRRGSGEPFGAPHNDEPLVLLSTKHESLQIPGEAQILNRHQRLLFYVLVLLKPHRFSLKKLIWLLAQ